MGVDVHFVAAEEADEGLMGGLGEFNGEAAGGGDGGDERDVGGKGFLNDFEGDPAADHEEMIV